jgi:hypothetical protein
MKIRIYIVVVLAIELFVTQLAPAQGTLFVSNLSQPSGGSGVVANNAWLALAFYTGTNSGGYDLNSIQMLMNGASGSPSNFAVSLYQGANLLGSFSGSSNPSTAGVYAYTASGSGFTVLPSTQYLLVLTDATPLSDGNYNWSYANNSLNTSYILSDGWEPGSGFNSSDDGLSWQRNNNPFQFAIYATEVPEPEAYVLAGLGLAALGFWRRKA